MKKIKIKSIITIIKKTWLGSVEIISGPGEYPAGNYILMKDITVSSGNGLSFSGDVNLNMNGKKITGENNNNNWDYGILANGKISVSSNHGGSIIGFRVGLKTYGNNSLIKNIKFIKNRYIAIMVEAKNCRITNCHIEDIGGVDDEPYAIGIQVSESNNTTISQSSIKNIYKQTEYRGTAAGEGLGINLAASSVSCKVHDCRIINDTSTVGTIGIFCGVRGNHDVHKNIINNFCCGIGAVSDAVSKIHNNEINIDSEIKESYGIFGPMCDIKNNTVSGKFFIRIESNNPSISY